MGGGGTAIVDALGDLGLDYPEVYDERREELVEARRLFDKEEEAPESS